MWNEINRRKFPRVHYKCLICINKKSSAKAISTRTENIGEGGICVVVDRDLGLFQGVNVELNLENGISSKIACNGTVVWVVKKRNAKEKAATQYDTGIEFVNIGDEGKNRIAKIVAAELEKGLKK